MPNVTFYRGDSEYIRNLPIRDGQLIYNTVTGENYEDVLDTRIKINTSGGAKVLWKNASPGSEFLPQMIQVPGLSRFTHYAVITSYSEYNDPGPITISPVGLYSNT